MTEEEVLMKDQATNIIELGPIVTKRIIPLIRMEKMKGLVSGFVRLVIYESSNPMNRTYLFDGKIKFDPRKSPEKNKVIEIREGEFKHGMLNGYGRVLKIDGTATVGFFNNDRVEGKVQYYKDGILEKQGLMDKDTGNFQDLDILEFNDNMLNT
jgi:hypothetical protein